jgi:hypothetical protein
MFLGLYREHLAPAPFGQFFSDLFNQLSFFRIELLLWSRVSAMTKRTFRFRS